MNIGVLGSGQGTNFEAILDAIQQRKLRARVCVVLSDRPDAQILAKARNNGIPAVYVAPGSKRTYLEPEAEECYVRTLVEHGVEWVVLAGFMRVLKSLFFKEFSGRIINIHPSLLPSFRGLEAWRQALEFGAKVTGCTVHLVDEGVDTGPILVQECVRIEEDDTPETLHRRIQEAEHRAYPQALQLIAEKRLEIAGRRVIISR